MAGKDKITQKDVIDSSVVDEFKELNQQLAISVKLMAELSKNAVDLNKNFDAKNIQDVVKSQEDYNKVNEESQQTNKETVSNLEKLQQKIRDVNVEEEKAKIALQEKKKAIKDSIKAQKDQTAETIKITREIQKEIKTEKEATEQNKRLLKVRKELDGATEKGAKQITLINKKIDSNNALLKKNASQLGKQKIGIGEYERATKGMGNTLSMLPGSFGGAASGAQRFGGMLKALAANPVVLILIGIVAALKGLVALFKSTDDGGTKLEATMNGLKAVFQVLKGVMLDMIEGTKARFERFGKRFQLLKEQIKGNDVEVAKLKGEIQALSDQIASNNPFDNLADRAKDAFQAVSDLTFEMDSLNDRMIAAISSQKQLELEMESQITLAADITKSDKERIGALESALTATKKFYGNRKKFAEEAFNNEIEIEAARREVSAETIKQLILMDDVQAENARANNEDIAKVWNQSGDERIKSLEEMYVSFLESDIDYAKKTKRIITQLSGLQKRSAEERIVIKQTENEDTLALIEEQNEKELELLDEKLANEHELELEKLIEFDEQKQELREVEAQQENDALELKKQNTQAYVNFAIGAAGALSSSIFGFLNAQTDAQLASDIKKAKSRGASVKEIEKLELDAAKKKKNRALTEAVINTALGVTSALTGTYPLSIIMAILAAALGAIEIATISSQSFAKGTKDSGPEGMIAEVGEAGTERINYADGTSALTPNGSTYTYLPPHSEVVPNRILQQDLAQMQAVGRSNSSKDDEQRRRLEHKEMMRAIKNRDETVINITEGGFGVIARKGMNKTSYIDNNYRS